MAITINIPSGGTVVFLRPYGVPGNATTDPSGSTTVTLGGSYAWFTETTSGPYKVTDKIKFKASKNTGTSSRNATVTIVPTTGADSRYDGTASVTCAYTITQAASPEPPAPSTCSINISNDSPYSVYLAADGYEDATSFSISIRENIASNSQITVSFTAESVTIDYIAITSSAPTGGIFYCYDSDSGQYAECTYAGGTWSDACEMPFYHADDTLYIEYWS